MTASEPRPSTAHRALDLTGRVALVTGGGSGIGAGIAAVLGAAGAHVVVVGRRPDRLAATCQAIGAAGGQAEAVEWDIADGTDAGRLVEAVVERAGRVDVLVHAAGNQVRKPALEFGLEDWDAVLGLHLRAAFALSQAVARHLHERTATGSIVYVGSMTSQRWGIPGAVAYAAAKSGLLGLMRALAVEWAPAGIRVNAILVGFVATEMTADIDDTPARRAITGRIPSGRLGSTEEIGDAAAFLASDLSAYVTGESLTVDGGWSVA